MQKVYLFITSLLISGMGFSQKFQIDGFGPLESVEDNMHIGQKPTKPLDKVRGSANCIDTNTWALMRNNDAPNPGYFTYTMRNDPSDGYVAGMSTFFDVPNGGTVEVSGMIFYARSIRPDGNSTPLNVSLYVANTAQLPNGAPLATTTIQVDTFTGGTIGGFFQSVEFPTSVSMSQDFCLVVDNQGTEADSLQVLVTGIGSGLPNYPGSFRIPGFNPLMPNIWYESQTFGANFAWMMHVYPFVEFTANNSLDMSMDSLCQIDQEVEFNGDAPVWIDNDYWTIEGYDQINSSYWSFDGGANFSPTPSASASNEFADPTQDYGIVRRDVLTLWQNGECVVEENSTLFGAALTADQALINLATGADSTDACDKGPGNQIIYTLGNTDIYYASDIIECDPNTVSGFYSDGEEWWEIDEDGMLINTGFCFTENDTIDEWPEGIRDLNAGLYAVHMEQENLVVQTSMAVQSTTTLDLFDLSGRLVLSKTIDKGMSGRIAIIGLHTQPRGLYLVRIGNETFKIVR